MFLQIIYIYTRFNRKWQILWIIHTEGNKNGQQTQDAQPQELKKFSLKGHFFERKFIIFNKV